MRNEILTGIFGGLFVITLFVAAGSFIGQATSHGPKTTKQEAVKTVPQTTEGSGRTDPNVKGDGDADGLEALPKEVKQEVPKTETKAALPSEDPTP